MGVGYALKTQLLFCLRGLKKNTQELSPMAKYRSLLLGNSNSLSKQKESKRKKNFNFLKNVINQSTEEPS